MGWYDRLNARLRGWKSSAIGEWDSKAQQEIRRGNAWPWGFAAWTAKQLSKAAPETGFQLAEFAATPFMRGTAAIRAIRGARAARVAAISENALRAAAEAGEITTRSAGRVRTVIGGAGEVLSPEPGVAARLARRGLIPNPDLLPKPVERFAASWAKPMSQMKRLGGLGSRGYKTQQALLHNSGPPTHKPPAARSGASAILTKGVEAWRRRLTAERHSGQGLRRPRPGFRVIPLHTRAKAVLRDSIARPVPAGGRMRTPRTGPASRALLPLALRVLRRAPASASQGRGTGTGTSGRSRYSPSIPRPMRLHPIRHVTPMRVFRR
jgi:hypothetical protein